MTGPMLWLDSSSLLSKYGFNDGDMPDALADWLEDRMGLDAARAVSWHALLEALVREFLAPVIEQDIELVSVETIHNPIRVERIHGYDVSDLYWYTGRVEHVLTPESVDVPYEVVLDRALRMAETVTPGA